MPKVLVTCQECGKLFETTQSQIKSNRGKYCSKKCAYKSQRAEQNVNWKPKIKKHCEQCGKEFEILPCKAGIRKYCSNRCSLKSRIGEKNHHWKSKIKRICEECGKEFEVHPCTIKNTNGGKYCSRSCSDKAHSKNFVGENHPGYKGRFPIICQTCKKTFYVRQGRASVAKYCNTECFRNRI